MRAEGLQHRGACIAAAAWQEGWGWGGGGLRSSVWDSAQARGVEADKGGAGVREGLSENKHKCIKIVGGVIMTDTGTPSDALHSSRAEIQRGDPSLGPPTAAAAAAVAAAAAAASQPRQQAAAAAACHGCGATGGGVRHLAHASGAVLLPVHLQQLLRLHLELRREQRVWAVNNDAWHVGNRSSSVV